MLIYVAFCSKYGANVPVFVEFAKSVRGHLENG